MQQPISGGKGPTERVKPTQPAPANATSAHGIVVEIVIELIGVSLMAIIADTGPNAGKLMMLLMIGFLIMWFLLNYQYLAGIVGRI